MLKKKMMFLIAATGLVVTMAAAQDLDGLMKLKPGRSRAVTSTDPSFTGNADRLKYIAPGETKVLADIKGPGVIRHIWLTFNEARPNWLESGGSASPDEIVIRMYWDGAKEPAVESPLGDFFGAGFGRRFELVSVPVQVETGGDGYNCFWQMPFFKRGLITVTNEGARNVRSFYYHIDYTEDPGLPRDLAYFCAQYNQAFPEKLGRDYTIAAIEGEGHYVGTVMSMRARSPMWFGEGDARFTIDDETKPSIQGTGTEDYFIMAWGMSLGQYPYFGCVYWSPEGEIPGTEYCMYRWHIADPVRFTKSLRFDIEHTGWISADETESGKIEGHVEREDDIATVAYWYQKGQPKRFTTLPALADRRFPNLDVIIEGKTLLAAARKTRGVAELQKGFDWTGEGQLFFKPGADKPALEVDFDVAKEEYRGLVLRMTYADDYGAYRVLLDGKPVPLNEDGTNPTVSPVLDFYSRDLAIKDVYLGSLKLAPGKHTLRFVAAGLNPLAKGASLGLDSVRLRQRWDKKRKLLT
ncbi:MAG: glycoside hydrolase family 172 protein [Candidatus Aminicenantales bacterium]